MAQTVLIRAELTAAELREARKVALDRDTRLAVLVGELVRKHLLRGGK